jgi:hypothetical protein
MVFKAQSLINKCRNNFGSKPTPHKSPATNPGPNQKKHTTPNQQKKGVIQIRKRIEVTKTFIWE